MSLRIDLNRVIDDAVEALAAGGSDRFPLIDGRIVHVLASPSDGTSVELAMGISVLPAGLTTPEHSHAAEEIALVRRGRGVIRVGDDQHEVGPGAVLVVAPDAPHTTTAGPAEPLVVYWQYGPAGSERRWRQSREEGRR